MSGKEGGSTAMNVYIVGCFALALAALVGTKLFNDERTMIADAYARAFTDVGDMRVLATDIRNYYVYRQSLGEDQVDETARRSVTHETLRKVGTDDVRLRNIEQIDVQVQRGELAGPQNARYMQNGCRVALKGVTQNQWGEFVRRALEAVGDYAVIRDIEVRRVDVRYDRIAVARGRDNALWNVNIQFIWFGPAPTDAAPARS
jgi:hypothetical protein